MATRVALPVLSLLLLAAHFFRGGVFPLVAAAIVLIGLAFVAKPWAGRLLALALACGTVEWLRTAWTIAALRATLGQPYARLLVILGAVAAVTLASAVVAWRSSDSSGAAPETD
jgi:hypothetical protein